MQRPEGGCRELPPRSEGREEEASEEMGLEEIGKTKKSGKEKDPMDNLGELQEGGQEVGERG